jgi:hypothetical protein
MSYQFPGLDRDRASALLEEVRKGNTIDPEASLEWFGDGEKIDANGLGPMMADLKALSKSVSGGSKHAEFEAKGAGIVHSHLKVPPFVAGHREFWLWVTFGGDEHGSVDLVEWRFGNLDCNDDNFGLGTATSMYEGLFARLWWRGHRFYDPDADDPYDLAKRGYLDFWRSHLIRPNYACNRTMARALTEFLYPEPEQISGHDPALIRELPKKLTAAVATQAFELLSLDECRDVLKSMASEIKREME